MILLLFAGGAPSTATPSQPRTIAATAGVAQVSVAFAAPAGQNLLTEDFTGSNGSAPNARWTVSGTGTPSIQSNRLRMSANAAQYGRALLANDYPADIELAGQVTIGQDQQMFPLVSFRGDGTFDSDVGEQHAFVNSLYLVLRPDVNTWRIFERSAGGSDVTVDGPNTITLVAGDVVNWIIQADGDDLGVRVWVQGTTEPVGYQASTDTDHSARTRLALSLYATVASTSVDWDNYRLGNFTNPAVTGYRVTLSPGGYTNTGTASPIVVACPAGSYTAVVEAENTNGFGPGSFPSPSFTVVGVSGTVAKTLANVTSAASGTSVSGTVARTLANVTSAASGGGTSIAGTVARTLDPVVSQATGGLGVTGTVARTLGNATVVAAGTVGGVIGAVAVTLDSVETGAPLTDENGSPITDESGNPILVRGAEGTHGVGGTLAETLADVISSATGAVVYLGTLAETLDNVTLAATGTQGVPGSLAETLENVTGAATGTVGATGTVAVTLGAVTSAAAGTSTPPGDTIAGNLAVTLDAVTSAAGGSSVAGQITATLADLTAAASGTAGPVSVTGLAAIVLADITSTASGVSTTSGTVDRTLADLVAFAEGSTVGGSLNETLDDITSTAVGVGAIVDFQAVVVHDRGHYVSVKEMA